MSEKSNFKSSICVICLDDTFSYIPYQTPTQPYLPCQCMYQVHTYCFRDWRLRNNVCLFCRKSLAPLSIATYISPTTWRYECCSKWVQMCAHLYCAYMVWVNIKDILYDSLIDSDYHYD